jgi:serine/threonine protein kinase
MEQRGALLIEKLHPRPGELQYAPYLSARYNWTPFTRRTRRGTLMMRWVMAFTLAQLTSMRIRLLPARCADFLAKFERAVRDLHSEGLAHHDLHARNVLYNPTNGAFYLIDFGNTAPSLSPAADDADRMAEVRRKIRRLCL